MECMLKKIKRGSGLVPNSARINEPFWGNFALIYFHFYYYVLYIFDIIIMIIIIVKVDDQALALYSR